MNKKYLCLSILGVILISTILIFAILLIKPVKICNEVLPYAPSNYCIAVSMKLPRIRGKYKLKYSLMDKQNLKQIFVNIRNYQGFINLVNSDVTNPDKVKSKVDEFTSPEMIGNIDKRNQKIDEMVSNFILTCENDLEKARKEYRYHNSNMYTNGWMNFEHAVGSNMSASTISELKDTIKHAKEDGIFPSDIAQLLREYRALGTPYCEIDSLGKITDCEGHYIGTVSGVFKPLGSKNRVDVSDKKDKTVKNETEIIKKAVEQYKKDKATAGEPNIKYEESGMPAEEARYGNAGMPKSLVLKDVPIICFEWANLGDDSKCTKKQLNTIETFFEDNTDIDWSKEFFEY